MINDQSLNQQQIVLVHKIIQHIENNGYMEASELRNPPFDKPLRFIWQFNARRQKALIDAINQLKENAIA